ncbi:hypothetical protein [uncultured Cetobacterium sp.]|uniref:hypothetical protein n=1 Tax=uncultured Cetobacterium sp. TaxID=527638 RepID=UPI0025EBC947|nr:hypothetical protein [uncultured Cetobacterium sp.]
MEKFKLLSYGEEVERVIQKILVKYSRFIEKEPKNTEYDFLVEFNKKKYAIEVKASREKYYSIKRLDFTINRMKRIKFDDNTINRVVVILALIDSENLTDNDEKYGFLYNDIRVFTIRDILLFLEENNDEELKIEVLSLLEFSVNDKYETKDIISNLKINEKNPKLKNYTKLLESIEPGREEFLKYEQTCIEILKHLFFEDLALWKYQEKTNEDLYRYDMICKIKSNTNKEFWNIIEDYFKTKYIIFEFKNYSEKISQKEIIITEKYLYKQALRGVAIIISRKGLNENAEKVKRGILRESGKLIIDLNDEDLKKMIKISEEGGLATDYLSEKLDELLIKLDK